MSEVVIRRCGNLIDLSPDGQSPLDPQIVELLKEDLTYQHKTFLRGHAQYSPDGHRSSMLIETRDMYAIEQGRLVTGFGLLQRVVRRLILNNITPRYYNISPPKPEGVYTPDWENMASRVEFRPKQEECYRIVMQEENGLIVAAPGYGKTFAFEALCHLYPRAKFAIVAKPKDVVARIVRQLSRSIPNVGQFGGGVHRKGERVTVYTAGSVHYSDGDEDFLLADEAHMLVTDTIAPKIVEIWRNARCFGFTATPDGRNDGADILLEQLFGPTIFNLPYPEAVALGLVVPIQVRWLPVRLNYNPAANRTDTTKMRWGVWRNEERNRIFAEDVRRSYPDPSTQILMLVATVDHAIHLWQHLPEFALCYGESLSPDDVERYQRSHMLPPSFVNVTAEYRHELRQRFESGQLKRVIATDVWSTGVDFAQLQVLYRLDARDSKNMDQQGPARVSRISPETGKQFGEVIDAYDAWDAGFRRRSENRRRHYKALGWEQINWPGGRGVM